MPSPKAVILSWVGPSDRPMPPTIFWADAAALRGATDWITQRGSAPLGVTPVETIANVLPCFVQPLPPSATSGKLLELAVWDGASASGPVALDANASRSFLAVVIPCLGEGTAAAGHLKSIQTMVNNASR